MKKFISVFLALAMLVCFAGCRNMAADPDDNTKDGTISDTGRDDVVFDTDSNTSEEDNTLLNGVTDGGMADSFTGSAGGNTGAGSGTGSGSTGTGSNMGGTGSGNTGSGSTSGNGNMARGANGMSR